jgi:hypothetical protein
MSATIIENFELMIKIYTKTTIVGWFCGLYNFAPYMGVHPMVFFQNKESLNLLLKKIEEDFNQTNDSLYQKIKKRESAFFDYFRKTFEEELPCCFLELLIYFVANIAKNVWLNLHNSDQTSLFNNYDTFKKFIEDNIDFEIKKGSEKDIGTITTNSGVIIKPQTNLHSFALKCKELTGCACKGLNGRPYKENPFRLAATTY